MLAGIVRARTNHRPSRQAAILGDHGTDAREAYWMPVRTTLHNETLAFDHASILRDAVEGARLKIEYTTVATVFCTQPFTLSDLRRVYELIWGFTLDPSNFRRKITQADGFLESTGQRRVQATGRARPCPVDLSPADQPCSRRVRQERCQLSAGQPWCRTRRQQGVEDPRDAA
jgi:hypothetical protein